MYNPKDIIDIIAGNVRKTRNPFGIPKSLVNRWHHGLDLPRQGEAMLFTGLMYQFAPYIEKSTHYLAKYEDTTVAEYIRFAKLVPSTLSGLGLSMITPGVEKKKSNVILQNIARILKASEVDFFYRPDLDDYSGVLLYDLGDQESFVRHARYVAGKLKTAGIKHLITVDPHTTYALKVLFPKYVGADFEVTTYFELTHFQSQNGHRRITLHDPCFYGRYLELSDVPKKILAGLDIECVPIRNAGLFTNCCGGPAESISPKLSDEVGNRRLKELNLTGEKIVAMCPICLGNLRKTGADVEDLSTVIAGQL
ncbi:MAG: (Fe-S)-binding protein [Desulfobacterales bacterium]|nr:(Fe-S)-binding protein [Desulfobacterales bacterium]